MSQQIKKETPLPKSAAQCADLLYETRQKRLAMQKEVDKLEALEGRLREYFVNSLHKDSTGVAGLVARVQIEPKVIPTVEDWPKFYAYVKKTGSFDLLQKRLTNIAVEERWEAGVKVPGVGRFNAKTVSCTLLKTKKR